MAQGKQTCKILKEIRRQIAESNGIEFVTSECSYRGDCLGTCPKCEAEVRYLERQLRARSLAGKAIALAGISATALTMLMPMTAESLVRQDSKVFLKENVPELADTIEVSGVVSGGDTLPDGTVSKEPIIGALVTNRRTAFRTVTDLDGKFGLSACIGDTLEVSYIGCETQELVVTEGMKEVTVTMVSQPLAGEVVTMGIVPEMKRDKVHYLDLNVIDEHGNPIDNDDIYVECIWTNSSGEEDSRTVSTQYVDEKHPCRICWDYGLKDEYGKPLKEATLSIEAEGYDEPVIIKVRCPKRRSANKTIRFERKEQKQ